MKEKMCVRSKSINKNASKKKETTYLYQLENNLQKNDRFCSMPPLIHPLIPLFKSIQNLMIFYIASYRIASHRIINSLNIGIHRQKRNKKLFGWTKPFSGRHFGENFRFKPYLKKQF